MNQPIHRKIIISGRVQGVFFRVSTQQKARLLKLSGFVRNQPDGTVYIEVEGESDVVEAFVKWCSDGPMHANVDSVEINNGEIVGYKSFEIE